MSYRLKAINTQQYVEIGIPTFARAQELAIKSATENRDDVSVISEHTDEVLCTASYNQVDDVRIGLTRFELKDTPWI